MKMFNVFLDKEEMILKKELEKLSIKIEEKIHMAKKQGDFSCCVQCYSNEIGRNNLRKIKKEYKKKGYSVFVYAEFLLISWYPNRFKRFLEALC